MAFHFWAYLRHESRMLAQCAENLPTTTKDILERCDYIITEIRAFTPFITYSEPQPTNNMVTEEDKAVERVLQYTLEEGRRLGRTRTGRFCNAMYNVQEGDAIVALKGADRLFIIRSVGNTYKLVGDIFVDGLMDGEAYDNEVPDKVDYDIELA